jgi:hypothetical protein
LARPIRDIDPNDYLSQVHPDDLAGYLASLAESARTMGYWSHEFRYFRNERTAMWLLVAATPERCSDGSILWHGFRHQRSRRRRPLPGSRPGPRRAAARPGAGLRRRRGSRP